MNKCILFSRVSTLRQDLDQQTNELVDEAKRMGYDSWTTIEDKESAICLDEYERHGLNELKRLISTKEYDTVLCYEISRISRRPKVLYSIRDLLIDKGIQLVILKPYMRLLDNDGKMNQSASIMFSLFSSLSESEMMIKKERMIRGKKIKKELGYFGGGHVSFGYRVHNKKVYVYEDEAKIVRDIFRRTLKDNPAVTVKDYYELGIFEGLTKREIFGKIDNILRCENYRGNKIYPQIVDDDTFLTVKNKIKPRIARKLRQKLEEPLCKGIFIRSETGQIMRTNTCTNKYFTIPWDRERNRIEGVDTHCCTISINIVDSLVWSLVKDKGEKENEVTKEELETRISEIRQKILNCDVQKKRYVAQIDKVEERIIMGRISDEKGDELERNIKNKIEDLETIKRDYDCELSELVIRYSSFDMIKGDKEELNWNQMRETVLKFVKVVDIKRINWNEHCIDIQFKDSKINKYTVYHNRKGDYCVLNEENDIINFELLNKWKSNTLNYNITKIRQR